MTYSGFTVNFQVGWMWGFRETGVNDNSKVWGLRHWKDGVVINWGGESFEGCGIDQEFGLGRIEITVSMKHASAAVEYTDGYTM